LGGIPGTGEGRRIGKIEVSELVDGHVVVQGGCVDVGAFGDFGAVAPEELGAEEASVALVAGESDSQRCRTGVVRLVVIEGSIDGAIAAARRVGLDLSGASTRHLTDIRPRPGRVVVTVCDRAHEELDPEPGRLHWSIPDPVPLGTRNAFDATVVELRDRICELVGSDRAIS